MGDFEGKFQPNLQAKTINYFIWKFRFILLIFKLADQMRSIRTTGASKNRFWHNVNGAFIDYVEFFVTLVLLWGSLFLSSPIECVACERTELLRTEIGGGRRRFFASKLF